MHGGISGCINLLFRRGEITFETDGTVVIGTNHLAWPHAQPQPFFQWRVNASSEYQTLTTNGAAMLRQLVAQVSGPALVQADFTLLCGLLISPDGLTIHDIADARMNRHKDGVIVRCDEGRFGLQPGSAISFSGLYEGINLSSAAEIPGEFEDF